MADQNIITEADRCRDQLHRMEMNLVRKVEDEPLGYLNYLESG